jgi:phosphohistidine phosphatase
MKTLLVLRHAKSSWDHPELADFDRPLNNRGKADAPRMGKLLRAEDLVPEKVISSSAVRAKATAKAAAKAAGYEGDIAFSRELYHADAETFIELLRQVAEPNQRVLVVGHNPDLEEFVEALTGELTGMPTAALAQIKLPIKRWSELSLATEGELVIVWRPKELS